MFACRVFETPALALVFVWIRIRKGKIAIISQSTLFQIGLIIIFDSSNESNGIFLCYILESDFD